VEYLSLFIKIYLNYCDDQTTPLSSFVQVRIC